MPITEDDICDYWFNSPDITGAFISSCGKSVRVINRGHSNFYDGPDILQAIVSYDGLRFFGNIEFHTKTSDWYAHKHHLDQKYNNVVLHVVAHPKGIQSVTCENEQSIPTIFLPGIVKTHIKPKTLACAGNIKRIHPEILSLEIEKAAVSYFGELVQRLASWQYGLGINQQINSALVCAFYDVLGIPANREYMHFKALRFLEENNIAVPPHTENSISPKHKVRWANQPQFRLFQAESMCKNILKTSRSEWINNSPEILFDTILKTAPHVSKRVKQILWCVAFLPGMYLLNNLIGRTTEMKKIFELWKGSEMTLPSSYLSLLDRSEWPKKYIIPSPGLVYKVKNECLKKQCEGCEIFQSSLSA